MFYKLVLYVFVSIFVLTGCQPETSGELLPFIIPAKPQVWTVQISDGAMRVRETFKLCDDAIPGISLLVEQSTQEEINRKPADFVFASDSFVLPDAEVYPLYEDTFNIITHFTAPVYSITTDQVRDIFSGRVTDWIDIDISSSYGGEIHRFGYSDGSDLQRGFEGALGEGMMGKWYLVPDPEAMLLSVLKTPDAIGFLPEWAAGQSVNIVEIANGELKLKINVYSQEESTESLNWLRCLRSELNP